jgi:hypothetical protein
VFKTRAFIGLIIETEEEEVLRRIASQEGISVSELVRRIIREWLESEARMRYGLNFVFKAPRTVATDGASTVDPVSAVLTEDFTRSLSEVEQDVKKAVEEIRRLAGELDAIEKEYSEAKNTFKVGVMYRVEGRFMQGEDLLAEAERRYYNRLKALRTRFFEADSAIRNFFSRVYYPWLKLRREVTVTEQVVIGQRVANLYRLVASVRKQREMLSKKLSEKRH